MNYLIYILAFLGVIFLIGIIWFIKTVFQVKRELKNTPRSFTDAVELIKFIRNVFECKVTHNVVIYGFVEETTYDDLLARLGMAEDTILHVDVAIITSKGHESVSTQCGNIHANLKRGDFVAVLPNYSKTHKLWYYTTIAKLDTVYLGTNGFLVKEQYLD